MANLTIAVDDEVLRRARIKALQQGTSVNALLRDYLNQFAGLTPAQERAAARFLELAAGARSRRGSSRWTREDLHQR